MKTFTRAVRQCFISVLFARPIAPRAALSHRFLKIFPRAQEIAEHNKDADCWIVIHDKVYDVTKFLSDHPGGPESMLEFRGRDAGAA